MKIAPPKYMRDFYPEDMRLRSWIEDAWRDASLAAGFAEWDCPIMENLELYKRKSGDEIVGQLFSLTTKGGDQLAIRPEMTPSLARMVAARQGAMPRPVKWFCISRMCRYERGQRGRLREFWQWNADVLGVPGPIADAEVISVALDGLIRLGLADNEIQVRINSRTLMAALLSAIDVPEEKHAVVYAVTDKRGKASNDDLTKMYAEIGLSESTLGRINLLMACESLDQIGDFLQRENLTAAEPALAELRQLFELLDSLGKGSYCRFDIGIVRGLAYYTGPVFEIYDVGSELRAICGGGRYDRLLETMGGQAMPACGFGMGDVVLGELLKDVKKIPQFESTLDDYVIALEDERLPDALRLVAQRRAAGRKVDYAVKASGLGKALKRASELGVRQVILVGGDEWQRGVLRLKNMLTGTESEIPIP